VQGLGIGSWEEISSVGKGRGRGGRNVTSFLDGLLSDLLNEGCSFDEEKAEQMFFPTLPSTLPPARSNILSPSTFQAPFALPTLPTPRAPTPPNRPAHLNIIAATLQSTSRVFHSPTSSPPPPLSSTLSSPSSSSEPWNLNEGDDDLLRTPPSVASPRSYVTPSSSTSKPYHPSFHLPSFGLPLSPEASSFPTSFNYTGLSIPSSSRHPFATSAPRQAINRSAPSSFRPSRPSRPPSAPRPSPSYPPPPPPASSSRSPITSSAPSKPQHQLSNCHPHRQQHPYVPHPFAASVGRSTTPSPTPSSYSSHSSSSSKSSSSSASSSASSTHSSARSQTSSSSAGRGSSRPLPKRAGLPWLFLQEGQKTIGVAF
jgi:hypothetical protein